MEFNVNKQIKNYCNKINSQTDTDNEEFADATSENSVRASKFLGELNLDLIMPEINNYYSVKEGVETYPRRVCYPQAFAIESHSPYLGQVNRKLLQDLSSIRV